jgi:hypothetical protein
MGFRRKGLRWWRGSMKNTEEFFFEQFKELEMEKEWKKIEKPVCGSSMPCESGGKRC